METIGRMLSEYSSMFGSEEAEGLDKDKIMEAFEVDGSSDASEAETDSAAAEEELAEVEEVEVVSDLTKRLLMRRLAQLKMTWMLMHYLKVPSQMPRKRLI